MAQTWEEKSAYAKKLQEESIPKQWLLPEDKLPPAGQTNVMNVPKESGALTAKELEITESTATVLAKQISAGALTAEEVVTAFLKRAVIGQQLTNFATEFLADEAIARARELDAIFKETGKTVGPLHGIPISVKEHVALKGKRCNAGFVAWVNDELAEEDSLTVAYLKNAGAVVHVRTNEPQSLMHVDTSNNITGKTSNPHNLTLSAGGSSGGEGVSLGFKASALGVGTDIGGSIRAPAAFNGVYGLRPSAGRLSLWGFKGAGFGQESCKPVIGPLTGCVEDIDLWMKAVLDQKPWTVDPDLVPLGWRAVEKPKTFTVGLLTDDGINKPHPPVARALEHAREKLTNAGIKVVDFNLHKAERCSELVTTFWFADNGVAQKEILDLSGEPYLPLTNWALSHAKEVSTGTLWKCNYERDVIRAEYHKLLKDAGIDFVLGPAFNGVAAVNGTPTYFLYTSLWNFLDKPAVAFPSGLKVDQELDKVDTTYKARNAVEEDEYSRYSPEKFVDAPIALQLAGTRYEDEELVAALSVIDEILKA